MLIFFTVNFCGFVILGAQSGLFIWIPITRTMIDSINKALEGTAHKICTKYTE